MIFEYLQGYYAHTAALDDCTGKIREPLKHTGLSEDTILVFTSDHGDMLGSHRMGSKQSPFEELINVPFVIEYPRAVPQGERSDALLGPIDMMPTLLSMAGLDCPEVDGKDVSEAMTVGASDQQDAVLLMKMLPGGNPYSMNAVTPWRGVRTKRYTYTTLIGHGPWLLYDNEADPYQLNNLINKPDHVDLQAELEGRIRELMDDANDSGDVEKIMAYRTSRNPNS